MSVKKSVNALDYSFSLKGAFLKGGKLVPAYRAEPCGSCPEGVTFAAYSRLIHEFIFCTEDALYGSEDGKSYRQICNSGAPSPFMIENWRGGYTETAVVAGDLAATYWNNSFLAIRLGLSLNDGALHCGRLFGADGENPLILRWSGGRNVTEWSGGVNGSGSLKLDPARGNILNIKVYNGKLVAVREYGLTVLSMYGSPESFSVDITDTDCDKIYKGTACVVGDKLYFCSRSGLKYFDGARINGVAVRHGIHGPSGCAEYAGVYFLACGGGILCVDTADGESCFIDAAAEYLFVKDGVYFCGGGRLYRLERGTGFSFKSSPISFGTGRLKTVTEIDVQGTADIKISGGGKTRIFTGVSGSVHPRLRGRDFTVEAEGDGVLSAITVTAEVTNAI